MNVICLRQLLLLLAMTVVSLCAWPANTKNKDAGVNSNSSPSVESLAARLSRVEGLLRGEGLLQMLQKMERLQTETAIMQGRLDVIERDIGRLRQRSSTITQATEKVEAEAELAPVGIIASEPEEAKKLEEERSIINEAVVATGALPPVSNTPTKKPEEGRTEISETVVTAGAAPVVVVPAKKPEKEKSLATTETTVTRSILSPLPGDTAIDTEPESTKATSPLDGRIAYDKAFALLEQGDYSLSTVAFTDFLQKYPDNEYADIAQYWLGETQYLAKNYHDAIQAYRELINRYPESRKKEEALLKIGYSQQALEEYEGAIATFEAVKQGVPGTVLSRLANERLLHIRALKKKPTETVPVKH